MNDDTDTLKRDAEKLKKLIDNLKDEESKLKQVLIDANDQIEAETADDSKIIADSVAELDALEKQADEEENQGNIQDVQGQIASM